MVVLWQKAERRDRLQKVKACMQGRGGRGRRGNTRRKGSTQAQKNLMHIMQAVWS